VVAERPRFLALLAFFLATGVLAFAYMSRTIYSHAGERLSADGGAIATHAVIEHWMTRGYFASHGMLSPVANENIVYRWLSGAYFISS